MERLLLVLGLVLLLALLIYGLYAGWRHRAARQSGLGRRAAGAARLSAEGVCIERDGESDIFIPAADLVEITTAPGIAGKVIGQPDGILVMRWTLAGVELDSGFRADDSARQDDWIDAARALIAARPAAPTSNGGPS